MRHPRTFSVPIACGLAITLAGCQPKVLTPADFAFVTTNTTFVDLLRSVRVAPDRQFLESNTIRWEYALGTSGHFFCFKDTMPPFALTNKVQVVGILPRPTFIDFSKKQRTP